MTSAVQQAMAHQSLLSGSLTPANCFCCDMPRMYCQLVLVVPKVLNSGFPVLAEHRPLPSLIVFLPCQEDRGLVFISMKVHAKSMPGLGRGAWSPSQGQAFWMFSVVSI
jgi:hypothetical protein